MSEYLKNLQESVILTESFHRTRDIPSISEEEMREELSGLFEDEEIDKVLEEGHWKGAIAALNSPINKPFQGAYDAGSASGAGKAALAIGVAAAATAAGIAAYKRFFSQAAKACSSFSGSEKTNCMNKYKVKAQQAKVSALTAGKAKCKGSAACKGKLDIKIAKEKSKLGK